MSTSRETAPLVRRLYACIDPLGHDSFLNLSIVRRRAGEVAWRLDGVSVGDGSTARPFVSA